jgi:hypothetical protein
VCGGRDREARLPGFQRTACETPGVSPPPRSGVRARVLLSRRPNTRHAVCSKTHSRLTKQLSHGLAVTALPELARGWLVLAHKRWPNGKRSNPRPPLRALPLVKPAWLRA